MTLQFNNDEPACVTREGLKTELICEDKFLEEECILFPQRRRPSETVTRAPVGVGRRCTNRRMNDHEPITSRSFRPDTAIQDGPVRYHNYPTLMSGTCHPWRRSSSGPPGVITRPARECICTDRIDGGKTQWSVMGTLLY